MRFFLALLALLVPTFLMGGILPLLIRGFTRELPDLGPITGRLYGINTLGATLGTVSAGYLLLPRIGVTASILVGVMLNFGVAAENAQAARQASKRKGRKKRDRSSPEPTAERAEQTGEAFVRPLPGGAWLALTVGFAAAGFASLLSQLAWIRTLILVVGSSVYAFTITLTSFLAGIGIGSLLYGRFLSNRAARSDGSALGHAAWLSLAIGAAILVSVPLIGQLPGLFLTGYQAGLQRHFGLFQAFVFGLDFLVVLLPTLGMGALFPLIAAAWTRSAVAAGRGIGAAYAVNTAGTILGALLGGLLLLPTLGIQRSVILAASVYVLVALGFWLARPSPAGSWLPAGSWSSGFTCTACPRRT